MAVLATWTWLTVDIFIISLKLYILLALHLLSLIAILKCLQKNKMSSEILHYNLALKQKFILNAESHGTRTPLARQMFDIGIMTSISYFSAKQ